MESIAERQRREAAEAERLLPLMVKELHRGNSALDVARHLESKTDIESTTLFRWISIVEARLDAKKRRVGLVAAVLLWLGFAAVGAGIIGIATPLMVPRPSLWIAGGAVVMAGGLASWRFGKGRVEVHPEDL